MLILECATYMLEEGAKEKVFRELKRNLLSNSLLGIGLELARPKGQGILSLLPHNSRKRSWINNSFNRLIDHKRE